MPNFDVEAFVTRLDHMGMKLTAVPLADGTLRVNRWRMSNASEHTRQIEDLWSSQIGDNQERIDVLAAHLVKAVPRPAPFSISPTRLRIDSPLMPVAEPHGAPLSRETVAPQIEAALPKPPVAPPAVSASQAAVSQAATVPKQIPGKAAGASNPVGIQPMRPVLRATTEAARSADKQAASERPNPVDASDPRGMASPQKVAGMVPPGWPRKAR